MKKLTTEFFDGWPMMHPLGRRESSLYRQELALSEIVIGQVIGNYGQAVVATNLRVMVVKTGLFSGRAFGGTVVTLDYQDICEVEIRRSIALGEFELVTAEFPSSQTVASGYKVNLAEKANGVVYTKLVAAPFDAMATMIRQMIDRPVPVVRFRTHEQRSGQLQGTASSKEELLADLSQLHDTDAMTFAEYSRRKTQILLKK